MVAVLGSAPNFLRSLGIISAKWMATCSGGSSASILVGFFLCLSVSCARLDFTADAKTSRRIDSSQDPGATAVLNVFSTLFSCDLDLDFVLMLWSKRR